MAANHYDTVLRVVRVCAVLIAFVTVVIGTVMVLIQGVA